MEPQEILNRTREAIKDHAGEDPDKWFCANRFVFARLQLDERRTKTQIKRELVQTGKPCHYCDKPFDDKIGGHLHRLDSEHGYSRENCVLMHPECHKKYHAEHPRSRRPHDAAGSEEVSSMTPILEKMSKRYEGQSFIYWWDITPGFLGQIDQYEAVEFIKKDTGERCYVPIPALKVYLTKERQTSRGKGNWGIRVLRDRVGELAFESSEKEDKWLFLPVVWLNDTQEG